MKNICLKCEHFGVNGCEDEIWCYAKKKKASVTKQNCKDFAKCKDVKRQDGYTQLFDGEPITIQSNEVFLFKCCDCGLTHKVVIATKKTKDIGFAVERVKDGKKNKTE